MSARVRATADGATRDVFAGLVLGDARDPDGVLGLWEVAQERSGPARAFPAWVNVASHVALDPPQAGGHMVLSAAPKTRVPLGLSLLQAEGT